MFIISCTIRYLNMPPDILALRDFSMRLVDGSHYQWRQLDLMIRYVDLRADAYSGRLSDPEEIMSLGKELDDDCATLTQFLEDKWPHTTCYTDDTVSAYKGVYHVYGINFHQLKVWNSIRVGRLMINEIIQTAYRDGLKSLAPSLCEPSHFAFQASLSATLDMALELCRAVPQYCICLPETLHPLSLSGDPTFESYSSTFSSLGAKSARKYTYVEEASAYAMVHPLHVAVRSSAGHIPELKAWILDRLKFMGNVVGLQGALMVAESVEAGSDIDPWMVFAKLAGHDAPVNPFDPPTSLLANRTKVAVGRGETREYLTVV